MILSIHLAKTAGTSVVNTYTYENPEIINLNYDKKVVITTQSLSEITNETIIVDTHPYFNEWEILKNYNPFVFTFLRNPRNRLLSLLAFNLDRNKKIGHPHDYKPIWKTYKDFFNAKDFEETIWYLRNKVHFIGYYENLHKDTEKLFKMLNCNFSNLRYNMMASSASSREKVLNEYQADLDEDVFRSHYELDYKLYEYFKN